MKSDAKERAWQEFAELLLKDALAQRELTMRELSELLLERGVDIPWKTLSRRINRGSFDAGFLLACLTVLGAVRIEFEGERRGAVKLNSERVWKRELRRKPLARRT